MQHMIHDVIFSAQVQFNRQNIIYVQISSFASKQISQYPSKYANFDKSLSF